MKIDDDILLERLVSQLKWEFSLMSEDEKEKITYCEVEIKSYKIDDDGNLYGYDKKEWERLIEYPGNGSY